MLMPTFHTYLGISYYFMLYSINEFDVHIIILIWLMGYIFWLNLMPIMLICTVLNLYLLSLIPAML